MGLLKKILKEVLPRQLINWLNVRRENLRFRMWRTCWQIRERISPVKFGRDSYTGSKVYFINPHKIRYLTVKEFKYYHDHNRVVGGDWDRPQLLFDECDFFWAYSMRINQGAEWSETEYYMHHLAEIESGEVKWGCSNKMEWDQRCLILDSIFEDMKANGYAPQKLEDYISVNISREGALFFNDGRHRLTFAKLLQLEEIPVRITVRHSKWVAFKNQIHDYASSGGRKGKIYAPLTHIDLASVPSGYGHRRFELMRDNLREISGGKLLDIGAHWGYFCHRFEDLGFKCYAVENDPENLYFMWKLRVIGENCFTIIDKSIFKIDFKKDKFDVVLALAIFHHFTKEKKTFDKLVTFLNSMNTEIMFFEPPSPDEPQMQTAYRNFTGDEFASFIVENSPLREYEQIGVAEDDRKLYKIWK